MLPTLHELICFLLGFAGGLTVMGLVWFFFHIERALNAPQRFMEECLTAIKTNQ